MSKETCIINCFDPATRQIERVTVTREVFNAYRRTNWNIADNAQTFYKHEIQLSSLIGGEEGNYENFREFVGDRDELDELVEKTLLLDALNEALKKLSARDYALINALYFEWKTLMEYAKESRRSISTLFERRERILSDLKRYLKEFEE